MEDSTMDETKYSELFPLGVQVRTEGVNEKVPLGEVCIAIHRHILGD
jgi:hypothetical protein